MPDNPRIDYEEIAKELLITYLKEYKVDELKSPFKAATVIAEMYRIILNRIRQEEAQDFNLGTEDKEGAVKFYRFLLNYNF
ncbi:MAG: hypothetical protein WC364_02470 [Eubacteriales bacterium]|jgi:hypothetical protein